MLCATSIGKLLKINIFLKRYLQRRYLISKASFCFTDVIKFVARHLGYPLWIQNIIFFQHSSFSSSIQYHAPLDIVITALNSKMNRHMPSNLWYKSHLSRQWNCWSFRCICSIACRRCSNYIFILDLTPGFNRLHKDNRKMRRDNISVLWFGAPFISGLTVSYMHKPLDYWGIHRAALHLEGVWTWQC